jgi:hypothetical protein
MLLYLSGLPNNLCLPDLQRVQILIHVGKTATFIRFASSPFSFRFFYPLGAKQKQIVL